jgi:hypothetical protein
MNKTMIDEEEDDSTKASSSKKEGSWFSKIFRFNYLISRLSG